MEHRLGVDHAAGDDETATTIVTVCPTCAARARAFQQPAVRGLKVTSVVIFGLEGNETWTVMARRGGNTLAAANGDTEEEALFDVLGKLGVLT